MISYANSVKNRPIFAERAQNDAAGNEIGRTYATKAEVPNTAGNAIDISNNTVSVNYDSDTLALDNIVASTVSVSTLDSAYQDQLYATLPSSVLTELRKQSGAVRLHITANTFYAPYDYSADQFTYEFMICDDIYFNAQNVVRCTSPDLSVTYDSVANKTWLNEQDVDIPVLADASWEGHTSLDSTVYFSFNVYKAGTGNIVQREFNADSTTLSSPITFGFFDGSTELAVKHPVVMVQALPANPDPNTLYVIPEV